MEYLIGMGPVVAFTSQLDIHEATVYSHDEAESEYLGDGN